MPKILVLSAKKEDVNNVITPLSEVGYPVLHVSNTDELFDKSKVFLPDIMLLDIDAPVDEVSSLCVRIRLLDKIEDVQIILIADENVNINELSPNADGYITRPINQAILISTINSHLRLKEHLDIFSTNNSELAKRFYQLRVLYDTSLSLAGTLDKRKLINIMNEGLEQSISYSICTTLIINNADDIFLLINSLYPITKRLENALKLRAVITYKSMFDTDKLPLDFNVNNITTEVNYKKDDNEYDLEVMQFSGIFSPISTQDKFFGTVEILRDSQLSQEDTTCFQAVVSQVALPLESAMLYEEIQGKNVKLEKLEKLKSEFISIVSHELRTPLTAIKNSIDIMLSGKTGDLTEKMAGFLDMGKRNVVRLTGIINDLLDLSKIEAGKMEYRFEKMNLAEPINLIMATFKGTAESKKIELSSKLKTKNAWVYGDTQKIEQVLSNLISNALKFTNEGGSVEISLTDGRKGTNKTSIDDYYLIEVKDSGIGISDENLTKVFDKFQQIESSLSRKVGGTGLGLPIAKELIETHKGRIWVESEEGKGTNFSFILPKYNEYSNFLVELETTFAKTQYANSHFGILSVYTDNVTMYKGYLEQQLKNKKIFTMDDCLYLIVKESSEKQFGLYLEKLQSFINTQKDDTILLRSAFYKSENQTLNELLSELEG